MAKLLDTLKFEIEYPSGTWNEILPTVDDIVFSKVRQRGELFYRLSLETELLFKKAAWTFISDIELNDHCADLPFRIIAKREGNISAFEGFIRLNDGKFNFSYCSASIPAQVDDDYTCLDANWKNEFDLLEDVPRQTVYLLVGTIEEMRCPAVGTTPVDPIEPANPDGLDTCLSDPSAGWVVVENVLTAIADNGAGGFEANQYTVWKRETVTSPTEPPGDGWIYIGASTWVRSPAVQFDSVNSDSFIFGDTTVELYWNVLSEEAESIDNGVLLSDALEYFLEEMGCSLGVVSDFFSINPDGTAPSNDAYTTAADKLASPILFQKSDVKRHNVSNNASIANTSLEKLLTYLYQIFQVKAFIDGGNLRLEHISYFSKTVGLDLTTAQYERWTKHLKQYSYDNTENPRYERWRWMDDAAVSSLFRGYEIQYGAVCANKDNDRLEYNIDGVTTDVQTILDQPDGFADAGFVLINAILFNGDYYFDTEDVFGSGQKLNGHLALPNLHYNYWRHYRFQLSGKMNLVDPETFLSTRPRKKGEPISIPGWCLSDFVDFDPNSLVETELGEGEIEKMTYSVNKGTVTFELIYP